MHRFSFFYFECSLLKSEISVGCGSVVQSTTTLSTPEISTGCFQTRQKKKENFSFHNGDLINSALLCALDLVLQTSKTGKQLQNGMSVVAQACRSTVPRLLTMLCAWNSRKNNSLLFKSMARRASPVCTLQSSQCGRVLRALAPLEFGHYGK